MEPSQNNNTEKPSDIYIEKDVLGLEKPKGTVTTKTDSTRIFTILAIVILSILVIGWIVSG